jgi:hypothetical protein
MAATRRVGGLSSAFPLSALLLASCVSTTPPTLPDASPARAMSDAAMSDSGDDGAATQPTCVVPVGTPPNELGVGGYCLANMAQCRTSLFCSADFVPPSYGFCTKVCSSDSDCGSGIFCYTFPSAQGGVSVCVPLTCRTGSDAGASE